MGRGDKGRRTRADLVRAARSVFAELGYFDTRLSDVTDRAGCSTGTLYTYFRNREDLLAAVIDHATSELFPPEPPRPAVPVTPVAPVDRIRRGHADYVAAYVRNADLMQLMEQVSHIDDRIRDLRLERARRFIDRNARSIDRWQRDGHVDPRLDPQFTSQALITMVSRLCYHVYVDRPQQHFCTAAGREELVDRMTRLWANTLRLD